MQRKNAKEKTEYRQSIAFPPSAMIQRGIDKLFQNMERVVVTLVAGVGGEQRHGQGVAGRKAGGFIYWGRSTQHIGFWQ